MPSATYRTLLSTPGAAAFFLTAAVGRVGIAMTSLGIVWLVHGQTDSYAEAGLVTGGFAVAEALAGPQLARLIDRFGQTRVLPPALLAHAASVAALLTLVAGGSPSWLMTAGGVLVGATIPQLSALSAARWSALLRGDRAAGLPTAFALESLSNALGYLAGPALVSTIGAGGHPVLGTVLAAVLVVAGGLAFAAQHRTAPPPVSAFAERTRARGSLLRPGFAVLVGHNLARRVLRRHAGIGDSLHGGTRRAPRSRSAVRCVELQRPAGRLAVRAAPVARGAAGATGGGHGRAGSWQPAAVRGRLTARARARDCVDRCGSPSDLGALLGAGRICRPPGRPDPGVHLAELRQCGGRGRCSGDLRLGS
ncbi:MFS transporter [Streptomyces sp. NPDC005146]